MPNRRDLRLDKYNISRNEYRKILYHCRDYYDKKAELTSCYGISISKSDAIPAQGQAHSDPTAMAAIRADKLHDYIDTIERTAAKVDIYVAPFIIRNVACGVTYDQFTPVRPPCGRRQFYALRRRFFWEMAQQKL